MRVQLAQVGDLSELHEGEGDFENKAESSSLCNGDTTENPFDLHLTCWKGGGDTNGEFTSEQKIEEIWSSEEKYRIRCTSGSHHYHRHNHSYCLRSAYKVLHVYYLIRREVLRRS